MVLLSLSVGQERDFSSVDSKRIRKGQQTISLNSNCIMKGK